MSEVFLASDTVNKCIQPCLSEETYVPISAAGNHVYTCTEIAQEQYVLVKLLPLSPPSLPQPHHGQGLGEPRLFGHGVETTQAQHAWMPRVCLFSGSEPSSHSSSLPVVLCLLSFFSWAQIILGAPSSCETLEKPWGAENGLLERAGNALPMQRDRERVAGLDSSPVQHPLSRAAELVTDDNLLLALVPSKLWQEQGGKRGDCWRCGCFPRCRPAAGSDSEARYGPAGGLLARSEPRSQGSARGGGRSSSTGLLQETIFSQILLKPLHPKCMLRKGIATAGSRHIVPGKGPKCWGGHESSAGKYHRSALTLHRSEVQGAALCILCTEMERKLICRGLIFLENESGLSCPLSTVSDLFFFSAVISRDV